LTARIERSLPGIDNTRKQFISPEVREAYEDFVGLEDGAIKEISSIEFETTDHDLREISVDSTYRLTYAGDTLFEADSQDILYGIEGEVAIIDPSESLDGSERHFMPTPIEHERLSLPDNVIANIGFWAIVEPFRIGLEQGTDFRSAAQQMRAIIHGLRTGEVT
jgi:hypothetical protein